MGRESESGGWWLASSKRQGALFSVSLAVPVQTGAAFLADVAKAALSGGHTRPWARGNQSQRKAYMW